MDDEEKWLPVVGWEALYEVSDRGRVMTFTRGRRGRHPRILRGTKNKGGYWIVALSENRTKGGRCESHFVHRLVLTAFVGARPPGCLTRHLDGNPSNNRLDNLLWGTHAENHLDSVEHGTFEHGEMRSQALLTNAQVIEIREAAARGAAVDDLAAQYGIAYRTASHIVTGTKWKRVGGPIQPRRDRWYLDDDAIREIRRLCSEGRSLNSVGKQFGVPPGSVKNIRDRKTYKWVD